MPLAPQAILAAGRSSASTGAPLAAPDLRSWRHVEHGAAMARVLIVGGDERANGLAAALLERGYAVRVVTDPRSAVNRVPPGGAERFDADPDRPGSLKAALEQVTIACWLFGSAAGTDERVEALHGARLERFLDHTIDSAVRGLVYEAAGSVDARTLSRGRRLVSGFAERNAIPLAIIDSQPGDSVAWLADGLDGLAALLERYPSKSPEI
jgi:hypothetical protein